jgi:hypothetical protein
MFSISWHAKYKTILLIFYYLNVYNGKQCQHR